MQNMPEGRTALGIDAHVGALLCYLGNFICGVGGLIYSIIVVVQEKTNKVVRFHAFQSIFLSIAVFVISIPLYIMFFAGIFIDAAVGIPVVTVIISLLWLAFGLAFLYFWIMAAVGGYHGKIYKIPVIGNLADKYSN